MGAESLKKKKLMTIKRVDRQVRDHNLCLLKAHLRKEYCPKYAKSPKNASRKSYPIKNPKYFSGHLTKDDDMQMTGR